MKHKTIDLTTALSLLGISSKTGLSLRELKRKYKTAVFKIHPDKGGSKEDTQSLNEAYEWLLKNGVYLAGESHDEPEDAKTDVTIDDEWFVARNAGHPLHACNLASMFSKETLIQKTFNIAAADAAYHDVVSAYSSKPDGSFYMKNGEQHLRIHTWSGQRDSLILEDVTNAGKMRSVDDYLSISVTHYNASYNESARCISNVFRDWFGSDKMGNEFSFGWLFNHLMSCVHNVNATGTFQLGNAVWSLKKDRWSCWIEVEVEGHTVNVVHDLRSSHNVLTPFSLDQWKPLEKVPEKWTVRHFIRLLVNGQFHHIKRNYYLTDDYAFDAAVRDREGYIDNPLAVAISWVGEAKKSCTSLYNSGHGALTYGFHSNDSSNLIVDLANRYLLEDVNNEVAFIEKNLLKLSA